MIDLSHDAGGGALLKDSYHQESADEVASMNVTEIMASAAQMLEPDESVVTAARIMKDFDIGCVLVGLEGRVAGIVTDRDIVLRGVANDGDIAEMTVAEIMSSDPMFCVVDDTVQQAARIMADDQIRRLPVLHVDRTLAGILSLGDICTHTPHNLAGALITEVSRPVHHELAETI